jgi:hypothetical protein
MARAACAVIPKLRLAAVADTAGVVIKRLISASMRDVERLRGAASSRRRLLWPTIKGKFCSYTSYGTAIGPIPGSHRRGGRGGVGGAGGRARNSAKALSPASFKMAAASSHGAGFV